MNNITIEEAGPGVDNLVDRIRRLPLHIQRDGKDVAVLLSPERYRALLMRGVDEKVNPEVVELMDQVVKERGSVLKALSKLG